MKNFILEILSSKRSLSAMRLMSITCVFLAGVIALYGISHGIECAGLSVLCGTFLAAAFTGKIMQKKTEVGNNNG